MSLDTIIWWSILGVAIVLAIVTLVFLARAIREVMKLKRRTAAYASLPVIAAAAQGELDIARIESALERIPELRARAEIALAALRRGPISHELAGSFAGLSGAVDELRELTG